MQQPQINRQAVRGRITAACSRDKKKLAGDWRGIRGNFGPPGTKMDLSHLKRYERFDDLPGYDSTLYPPNWAPERSNARYMVRFLDLAAARGLVGVGDSPPDAGIDVSELAAYTAVASLILNLDEVVMRP